MQSLPDVFDSYGVEYRGHGEHHHATRNRIQTDCPWCSLGFDKFRMGWSLYGSSVACWQCGRKDGPTALSKLCNIQFGKALKLWKSLTKGRIYKSDQYLKSGELENPSCVGDFLPAHLKYIHKRRFDPDMLRDLWGVRGIGPLGDYSWRLFIPINNELGQQVSWTTRAINDVEHGKYLTAPPEKEALHHKSVLYGAEHAQHVIIIHEGPTDVWAVGPGAVATCGLGYTAEQVALMIRYPMRIICFDSSTEAQRRANKLGDALSSFRGTTEVVELETGDDPASADQEEIAELRATYFGA